MNRAIFATAAAFAGLAGTVAFAVEPAHRPNWVEPQASGGAALVRVLEGAQPEPTMDRHEPASHNPPFEEGASPQSLPAGRPKEPPVDEAPVITPGFDTAPPAPAPDLEPAPPMRATGASADKTNADLADVLGRLAPSHVEPGSR